VVRRGQAWYRRYPFTYGDGRAGLTGSHVLAIDVKLKLKLKLKLAERAGRE